MEVRSNKLGDIRSYYRRKLAGIYSEQEADTLLFQVLVEYSGLSRAQILAFPEQPVTESELLKIHNGVKELLNHKPIQYVLGKAEFYGMEFIINSKVLIPRPETEELVEKVLKTKSTTRDPAILDIGTGSGCIAIVLKKYLPEARVTAIDISEFALDVAALNAEHHQTDIQFRRMDFFERESRSYLGRFDLVVSNPPYILPSEKLRMEKNVLDYEPASALFVDENDPFAIYREIAGFCKKNLNPGGSVVCELNQYHAEEIAQIFTTAGFKKPVIDTDLYGRNRFITCTW